MARYEQLKVGMKVLLDPRKCTQEDLSNNMSNGVIGQVYTIADLDGMSIYLGTANWHMPEWLTIIGLKNKIGGKLNAKRV